MTAPTEARRQFDAALGWLQLGNWQEAHEELERLPAEMLATPAVLVLRCRIYPHAGRWHTVEIMAEGAAHAYPEEPRFYTHWAWALHRQGRTADGLSVASQAAERFIDSGAIAYAVACLYGALEQVSDAAHWLKLALQRTHDPEKLRLRALKQPELFCLWQEADAELGPDDEDD